MISDDESQISYFILSNCHSDVSKVRRKDGIGPILKTENEESLRK